MSIALPTVLIYLEVRFPVRSRPHPSRRAFALDLTYWLVNPLGVQIVSKLAFESQLASYRERVIP